MIFFDKLLITSLLSSPAGQDVSLLGEHLLHPWTRGERGQAGERGGEQCRQPAGGPGPGPAAERRVQGQLQGKRPGQGQGQGQGLPHPDAHQERLGQGQQRQS